MRFRVLGPLRVWDGAGWTPIRAAQQRVVLAVLLTEAGAVVPIDRLVDEIWQDGPPRTAVSTIQGYVMRLRRLLGDGGSRGTLVTRGNGYELAAETGDVDAHLFARRAAAGRRALAARRFSEAATELAGGLELWNGQALADVPRSRTVAAEVARLEEARLWVTEDRLSAGLELGRSSDAVAALQRLVEEHPLRETLWRLLVLALHRSGRRADALAAYQQAHRVLAGELGIEPGPELRALQREILHGDPSPVVVAPAGGRAVPAQLPPAVAGFTGREAALAQLDRHLSGCDESHPVLMISAVDGAAGVGKTTLAVQWAHRVRDRFSDGQLYVNLRGYAAGPPLRPVDVLARFLPALGVPADQVPADQDEAAALYRSVLAGKRVLVVLDNANRADQVRPLLPGGGGCLALVTSRDRLAGLVARDGASPITLDVLTPAEAGRLLRTLLGAARADAEPAEVAALARVCGYLPLALRIAAAHITSGPGRTVGWYLAEPAAADLLSALEVDGDPHAALRPAFRHSYTSLPPAAGRLFRLLGLFPGPEVTAQAAAALAGLPRAEADRLLGRLAVAHLVEEPSPGRFAPHDLLRRYAAELAAAEETGPDRTAALRRLRDFYLGEVDAAAGRLYPESLRLPLPDRLPAPAGFEDHAAALRWLDAERPNLVAVVRDAAATGDHRAAWGIADRLRGYLYLGAHAVDLAVVAAAGLAAAVAGGDVRAQAAGELGLAMLHGMRGESRQLITHYTRAADLSRAAGWPEGESAALGNLAIYRRDLGEFAVAVANLEAALAIDRKIGWPAGEAIKLANLGLVWMDIGQLGRAEDYTTEALRLHRRNGSRAGEALTLSTLGEIRQLSGRLDQAEAALREALVLHPAAGTRGSESYTLCTLAAVHGDAGRSGRALATARAALTRAGETGTHRVEAAALVVQAAAYGDLGRHRRAVAAAVRAVRVARAAGHPDVETDALAGLAGALRQAGHPEPAAGIAAAAVGTARQAGMVLREGRALTELAAVQLGRGRPLPAADLAARALEILAGTGHRPGQVRARALLHRARMAGATGGPGPLARRTAR